MSFVTINSVAFIYPGLPFCLIPQIFNPFSEVTNSSWLYSTPDKGPGLLCLRVKGSAKEPVGSNYFRTPANLKTGVFVLEVLKVNEWVQMGEHL